MDDYNAIYDLTQELSENVRVEMPIDDTRSYPMGISEKDAKAIAEYILSKYNLSEK